MPAIVALDEIKEQLGEPVGVRMMQAPHGSIAAVARFRHHGGTVDLTASSNFRLIFHLTASEVETRRGDEQTTRRVSRTGDIVVSFSQDRERIKILSGADTLHFFFSPELGETLQSDLHFRLPAAAFPDLRACAVQALVAMSQTGSESQLESTVASVARTLIQHHARLRTPSGGLTPQAVRSIHNLMDERLGQALTVRQLAEAAGLSIHHFIKCCRVTEGCTPHTLLLHKRMERAIGLLSIPGARVDEVAMMTGFSSPSHFIKSFRSLIGVTPAAYRSAVSV